MLTKQTAVFVRGVSILGMNVVESHTRSRKHQEYANACQQTPISAPPCVLRSADVLRNPQPIMPSSDLLTICGSVPSLKQG